MQQVPWLQTALLPLPELGTGECPIIWLKYRWYTPGKATVVLLLLQTVVQQNFKTVYPNVTPILPCICSYLSFVLATL